MDESILSDQPQPDGIANALNIEYLEFGKGKCLISVLVGPLHTNMGGVAHGALFSTLLDKSLGGSLISTLRKEEWCATAQLSISFIDSAQVGTRLFSRGVVVRKGRAVAHLSGEVVDDSEHVYATATGTWAIFSQRPSHYPTNES